MPFNAMLSIQMSLLIAGMGAVQGLYAQNAGPITPQGPSMAEAARPLSVRRIFEMRWDPVHGSRLSRVWRAWNRWEEDPFEGKANINEIRNREGNASWTEFIPKSGPSIWIPGGPSGFVITGSEPGAVSKAPAGTPPYFSGFHISSDIDGKGYRIWNGDRTRVLKEELFPEEDWDSVEVRLEPVGEDSMNVHVAHAAVSAVGIQFSLDGESWSDMRLVGNHAQNVDLRRSYKDPADLHLPAWVLKENPHPWIEVDVAIGMTIITRRFKYRESPEPVKGNFKPCKGPESEWARYDMERQWKAREDEERREAAKQGRTWSPAKVQGAEKKSLKWSADVE